MIYLANLGALIREGFSRSGENGSFAQNYLALLSGAGINILVQVLVSPILTRMYGPEAYGVYALFNAFCTNIAMVATLRFPQAFLLPQDDIQFHSLMRLSVISTLTVSFISAVAVSMDGGAVLRMFNAEKLSGYVYLIPFGIFLVAVNQIFGQWQYRMKAFKKSVAIDTSLLVGVRAFNLAFGFLSNGMQFGLIFGDVLGKLAGLGLSIKLVIKNEFSFFFRHISFRQLKENFLAYKAYPFLNLPGVWLTLTSEQLPFFLLTSKFGLSSIGLLTLSISILDLPKRLFAYSVSSVFYKEAVDLHNQSMERLQASLIRMFYLLILLSAIPYAAILIFGPGLFAFVFGSDWVESGILSQYLALYYVLEFICISFGSLFYVFKKEKQLFYFQVFAFIGRLLVLLFAVYSFDSLLDSIALLVFFNFLFYTGQLFYLLGLAKLPGYKYLLQLFLFFALTISACFGIKLLLNHLSQ
jgi:O-antigen/teichoic acid export membrane protein